MDLESILYLAAAVPVVHRFLSSQARLATVSEHAIKQNSDLMARQTVILETIVPILQNLSERVEELEQGSAETVIVGFSSQEEEEGDDDGDDEEQGDDEPQPMNRRVRGFRRG